MKGGHKKMNQEQIEMIKKIDRFPELQKHLLDRLVNEKGITLKSIKHLPGSDLVILSTMNDLSDWCDPVPLTTTIEAYDGEILYGKLVGSIVDESGKLNRRGSEIIIPKYTGKFSPYSNLELLENTPKEIIISATREDGLDRAYEIFMDKNEPTLCQKNERLNKN